jgi:lysozyme
MKNYVLRKGDKGQEVKRLQSNLNITADGDFGPKTEKAVKKYQTDKSLSVDGVVGSQTLRSLGTEVLHGIDVSAWNGRSIDWDKVSKTNVKYCWIKVTEGATHVNGGHEDKFKGARDAGLIVGGYHFGRPDYNKYDNPLTDAEKEAHHFLKHIKKVGVHSGDLLPVLDVEAGMKTDDQYNVDWTLKWLDVVEEELGVKSVIYSAKWAWGLYLYKADKDDLKRLTTEYPIWWARYKRGKHFVGPEDKLRGWKEWDIWQYTGHGQCPGIKGRCDLNWMAGGQLSKLRMP